MKCELKVAVNMKLQGGGMFKLKNVLYVPQAANNLLMSSRLV